MNYDIVIAFRIDDNESARMIKHWLEEHGYKNRISQCNCNFGGGFWNPIMHDRIEKCSDFILIISDNTFKRSFFVRMDYLIDEIEHASIKGKRIVPIIKDFGHYKKRYIPRRVKKIISAFNQIKYHNTEELGFDMCMKQMVLGEIPYLLSKPHIGDAFYQENITSESYYNSVNTYQDSAAFLKITNK